MNILLLSVGTRNKIIQYFKNSLTDKNGVRFGEVIATDMNELAPAIYEADKYYIVPRISDKDYMNIILDICKKNNIKAVLSLIDKELSLLAFNTKKFKEIGVTVIGSSYKLCEMSLNKMNMYNWLVSHKYNAARSYTDKELFYKDMEAGRINYPVIIKPVCGSGSISVNKAFDKETIDFLFSKNNNLMIQEYLNGQEIGADVYIDFISTEVISIFTKKKYLMRAGETDKAISFKDKKLFELINRFVGEAGYRGEIDIDIFNINGEYYISEVNPRFGGGYPHAYECGCNHMTLIVNNLCGYSNISMIGEYESDVYMMKYNEIMVKKFCM